MTDLSSAKYVRLTSFTRDGRPRPTPVWIAAMAGNRLGTTSDNDSWKVRRIRNSGRVELTVSDGRGDVAADALSRAGAALIIDASHPDYAQLEANLISKYGLWYRLFRLIRSIRRKTPCGIVVTPDAPD